MPSIQERTRLGGINWAPAAGCRPGSHRRSRPAFLQAKHPPVLGAAAAAAAHPRTRRVGCLGP
eukprot:CAMPEP_0172188672 /NCGR_PEP_ID=MMETSP1050-20130122/22076_1 /TAXON_ID=233186 /ORGANISM="Cryptomonas curvata, Strain CCAP979/52" /LENGTH=62 /DNA_ID=CAMNT_0012863237 /DNA_START=746 /DNA_END=930 /DNA_ORIENTATION=+